MPKIDIDGKTFEVKGDNNLLAACLSEGLDLPYFCWHPSMGSVGACRQCAVVQFRDQEDQRGRIVMACMTPITDGMRISMQRPEAEAFRANVLELLMTNHPHDCPVCEEGGECHLQDMTVMTGHTFRGYRGKKRTHENQYLGPFINHEMNRCIACYRCIRFYQDYAGGSDLQVMACHNDVYFGRHEPGVLENEFSGNLVEVCPTGVFTDKTLSEHYSRKWDLQTAPSICVHCAIGCNISPGERYGELRRIVNRYNGEINGYFLCDRGRFGYGFVNSEARIRHPLINQQQVINVQAAETRFSALLQQKVIGIGSPRASLEANFALRSRVGADHFFTGLDADDHALLSGVINSLQNSPGRIPSLREVEQADAVLILGEDVTHTAPRLALALRQSVRNRSYEIAESLGIPSWQDAAVREAAQQEKNPVYIASCNATRLDDIAEDTYCAAPDDLARIGFAVAHCLDPNAPSVNDLSIEQSEWTEQVSQVLRGAKRPLVISGVSSQNLALIEAAGNIIKALSASEKALALIVPECNSIGLGLIGGGTFQDAVQSVETGAADTVIVLENDLYRRADRSTVDAFLEKVENLIVIDQIDHDTVKKADLVLPAATFAEAEGTLVSLEGRAQRYFPVFPTVPDVRASWEWLNVGSKQPWLQIDDITRACSSTIKALKPILHAAPDAAFRIDGRKIPRQPHRYSGRTAMHADLNVKETKPVEDSQSPFSFSMEGATSPLPSALIPGVWAPSWNSNQAIHKFQDEVNGALKGGASGVRLFEKKSDSKWAKNIPAAFKKQNKRWLLTPLYHIFGSEELSVLSRPLAERIPRPYIVLNSQDAVEFKLAEGDRVELEDISTGVVNQNLCVILSDRLVNGIAGIMIGSPGILRLPLNTTVKLRKTEETEL